MLAQPRIPANYDESKVGSYTLPDPLVLGDGKPVRDAATWKQRRRPEILHLFEENVYGRSPGKPRDMSFEIFESDRRALDGKAVRKQVRIYFSANKNGPHEDLLLYLPANGARRVPVVLTLNFDGNQTVSADPAIHLGMVWDLKKKQSQEASPETRGSSSDFRGAVDKVLARGFGFATIYYCDIEPDLRDGLSFGVRPLFFRMGQLAPSPDDWGAIGAWSWGLSRALDYMETDLDIDAKRVAVMGHSRLGKTVLWAGAQDPRFAAVVSNCSGEGGASLSRRNYGETVRDLNRSFPYWFCANYLKFGEHVDQLPVDAHELIALIAPRPVYIGSAEEDQWADPKGMFLAAVAAGPVYRLLGKQGLETTEMPALNQPILHDIAFHIRGGKHEITAFDWDHYLEFLAIHLRPAMR